MEWGTELFDRYDELVKHMSNSIDFLEHTLKMNTERHRLEFDYAKSMKRMVTRFHMKKKVEYAGAPLSYETSYNKALQEINSIALQHEVIGENLKQSVIDPTTKTIQDLKKAKQHFQQEFTRMEKQVNKSSSQLENSLRRYRTAHLDMMKADEAYKAAEENRNLARVEVDRQKQYAESKRQECERVKSDYAAQLEQTNKIRNDFFRNSLPKLLNDIQRTDRDRTEAFAQYLKSISESESSVMHTISSCLTGVTACANEIDWSKDSAAIVDTLRSGYPLPTDIPFTDLDSISGGSSSESLQIPQNVSVTGGTLRGKTKERSGFGWFKTKQKAVKQDGELGPEQKRKKINAAMKETQEKINAEEKTKASMEKLLKTYDKDPTSAQPVLNQIREVDEKLQVLREEMGRHEEAMREITGGNGGNGSLNNSANGQLSNSSGNISSSRSSFVVTPQKAPSGSSIPRKSEDDDDEFDAQEFDTPTASTSEAPSYVGGCTALYSFQAEDSTGLSMEAGDQFYVVQNDNGDGWTLVTKLDNSVQGYVPSGYLEIQLY